MLTTADYRQASRRRARAALIADLRDGRRQRATTVPARKGKGSYRRQAKHRGASW